MIPAAVLRVHQYCVHHGEAYCCGCRQPGGTLRTFDNWDRWVDHLESLQEHNA